MYTSPNPTLNQSHKPCHWKLSTFAFRIWQHEIRIWSRSCEQRIPSGCSEFKLIYRYCSGDIRFDKIFKQECTHEGERDRGERKQERETVCVPFADRLVLLSRPINCQCGRAFMSPGNDFFAGWDVYKQGTSPKSSCHVACIVWLEYQFH